jgi:DNA modification methylase
MAHISELTPDPANRRSHNPRNVGMLVDALHKVGAARSIVIDENGVVLAGNATLDAAAEAGITGLQIVDADGSTVIAVRRSGLTDAQKRDLALYDNRTAELASWNVEQLALDQAAGLALEPFWTADELKRLIPPHRAGQTEPDAIPELRPTTIAPGDLFACGPHRVLCGDATDPAMVARVMGDTRRATLLAADPPYGMGKEAEGVRNDNRRGADLDAFHAAWWRACRPHLVDSGSAYVWGTAENLWRFYFRVLDGSEPELSVRNEIVWDKDRAAAGGVFLEGQPELRSFPAASERALFLMLHAQALGNLNAADFPESFEPLRAYLDGERARMGWGPLDTKRITGVGMHSHWFSRSQWALPSATHYATLQAAAEGRAFTRSYADLRGEYEGSDRSGVDQVRAAFNAGRGYFDPEADPAADVWHFPRVIGAERFTHATPKPVALMTRIVITSAAGGDRVLDPFGGTGATLIACETTDRHCATIEIAPEYVQVMLDRWAAFTGQRPERIDDDARPTPPPAEEAPHADATP